MKKIIRNTIMVAGLLLLASCGPKEGVGPIEVPENLNTPTPIVVPTCTPTVTPTPDPAKLPAVTEAVKPTETPAPSETTAPSPEPTATPAAEPTKEPTMEPTVTETPVPSPQPTKTPVPTKAPTPSPEPTVTPATEPTKEPTMEPTVTETPVPSPEPTAALTPEATVTPTVLPTPTVDPKPLVYRGWQQTVSIDDEYLIIFPDMFRDSAVEKIGTELRTNYTCAEDSEIAFRISYVMQKTLEESLEDIPDENVAILEEMPEEKRMVCQWQENGIIYNGILLEEQYSQALLGNAFGDAEWITGVMQVVFSYPAERKNDYETVIYRYFVINDGEE